MPRGRAVNVVSEGEAPTLRAALKREAVVDPAGSTESGGPVARGSRTAGGSKSATATEPSRQRPGVPKQRRGSSEGEAGGATVLNADSPDADDETGTEPDLERTANGITDVLDSLLLIVAECRGRRVERPCVLTALLSVLRLLEAMVKYLGQHADEDLPAQLEVSLEHLLAFDLVDHKHVETPLTCIIREGPDSTAERA